MAAHVADNVFIDPSAEIDENVEIGPFSVIGPDVRIGRGSKLENNVSLMGHVTLGEFNHVFPGAVLGGEPQDISFSGTVTRLVIGDHNTIREGVTINRASEKEEGVTVVGNHNLLMAGSHVAHDCRIGDHVIVTNATLLGGHVHVHDHATISGAVGVHHFCTIGSYSFVAGMSVVRHDVPPYMLVEGQPARPRCLNVVALNRNGFSQETIDSLGEAHRLLFRAKVGLDSAREILRGNRHLVPHVNHLLNFVEDQRQGRHGRGRERRRAA